MSAAPPPGWQVADGALHARFRTGDFATGLHFVNQIGAAAEAADHHPDIDLRYGHVEVHLWSHDAGGVTDRDHGLARRISELADEAGLSGEGPRPT